MAKAINATDATAALSAYISTAVHQPLPDDVLEKTKHHLLDSFAAIISGSRLPAGEVAIPFTRAQGGVEEATICGTDFLSTAINAALANGMLAHADETDDTHQRGRLHPGATIIPVALAMAERHARSGEALLRAIALGYDIGVRVNLSLGPDFLLDAGHSTHSVGAQFGGTATAAALAALNPSQIRHALSYCVQQASGCPCYIRDKGHIEKAFDFNGMPARNAVTSVVMVEHGFTGVDNPFDSPYGFFDIFTEDAYPEELALELGNRFEIMDAHIKKWTVGNPNQTPIESMLALIRDHGLRPDEVEHVTVQLPKRRFDVANNSQMPDICMQHLLSVLLIDGTLTFASSHDAGRMNDPAVMALRERFDLVVNEDLDQAHPARPGIVDVTTKDGRQLSHRTNAAPGTPYNPMDRQEVAAKAMDLTETVIGKTRAQRLIETVLDIEHLESLKTLRALLQA